jgi:hypothetical protein
MPGTQLAHQATLRQICFIALQIAYLRLGGGGGLCESMVFVTVIMSDCLKGRLASVIDSRRQRDFRER